MTTYVLAREGHMSETRQVTQRTRPERRGWIVVDSWPSSDPPPADRNDATAWDSWRLRRGISGEHS